MHFKVIQEGVKLVIAIDQVAYIGLFLIGKALEWFKPYLMEIQASSITTTNQDIQFIFTSWNRFIERLIQMFKDLEVLTIAEQKL